MTVVIEEGVDLFGHGFWAMYSGLHIAGPFPTWADAALWVAQREREVMDGKREEGWAERMVRGEPLPVVQDPEREAAIQAELDAMATYAGTLTKAGKPRKRRPPREPAKGMKDGLVRDQPIKDGKADGKVDDRVVPLRAGYDKGDAR